MSRAGAGVVIRAGAAICLAASSAGAQSRYSASELERARKFIDTMSAEDRNALFSVAKRQNKRPEEVLLNVNRGTLGKPSEDPNEPEPKTKK